MAQQTIASLLTQSIADNTLDNDEKAALIRLIETISDDQKRFMRNQAFSLLRDKFNQPATEKGDLMKIIKWLERIIKLTDNSHSDSSGQNQAFFSPGNECREAIINQLSRAKKRIDICVFTISDNRISEAITQAHQRGVQVRVVTDNDKADDRGSDVYQLQKDGVPVCMDTSPSHMHHKFALVDEVLINGSFNWTRSASDYNQENIVISDGSDLIKPFEKVFNRLWNEFSER